MPSANCRLCGFHKNPDELTEFKNVDYDVYETVQHYCHVILEKNKKLSTQICVSCSSHLTSFVAFAEIVKYSQISQKMDLKNCTVTLEKLNKAQKVKKEIDTAIFSQIESWSDFDGFESDGDKFVLKKRKKVQKPKPQQKQFEVMEIQDKDDTKYVLEVEQLTEADIIELENCDLQNSDIEFIIEDAVESDYEVPVSPQKPKTPSPVKVIRPAAKTRPPPPKKKKLDKSAEAEPENDNIFEKYFSKEIEGTSVIKPIDLDIPDEYKEDDGRVVAGAMDTLSELTDLKCNKCNFASVNLLEIREHFKDKHTAFNSTLKFDCKVCDETEIKDSMFSRHLSSHNVNLNYHCMACGEIYWNFVALYKHYQDSHPETLKSICFCMICGTHMHHTKIAKHSIRHFHSGPGFNSAFKEILNQSVDELDNPLQIWESEKLEDGSIDESAEERLDLLKWKDILMDCNLCEEKNMTILQLKRHYNTVHTESSFKDKKYTCGFPSCVYSKSGEEIVGVFSHQNIHHDNRLSLCCVVCSRYFWNRVSLHYHYRKHHVNAKFLNCLICGHFTKDMTGIKRHLINHDIAGIQRQICYVCAKEFYLETDLKHHIQTVHSKKAEFECDFCHAKLKSKYTLKYHMEGHNEIRKFECDVCSMKFKVKSTYEAHYKTHFDEVKKFACSFCDRRFRSKSDCKIHQRLHTGDYPYNCEICAEKFPSWGNLQKHSKSRHKIDIASNQAKMRKQLKNAQRITLDTKHRTIRIKPSGSIEPVSDDEIVEVYLEQTNDDD